MISLDTETTGVDFYHGAKPFLVTTMDGECVQRFWEWDVDPLTREPEVDVDDIFAIQSLIDSSDLIVLQNAKFDAHALANIGIHLPFERVRDTLRGGHILASNHRHNLTDMCAEYLNVNIEPFEIRVREATKTARAIVRRLYPDWRLASEDDPDMPSVSGGSSRDEDKPWKNDMWLLRALGRVQPLDNPDWMTLTSAYANKDSEVTLPLWWWMEARLKHLGLWEIYLETLKLNRIAFDMEDRGATASGVQTQTLITDYTAHVDLAQAECLAVAQQYDFELELPAAAAPNDSIREFFWGSCRLTCPACGWQGKVKEWERPAKSEELCKKCAKRKKNPRNVRCSINRNSCLDLPKIYSSKTGSPTLDKDAMAEYEATLEPGPALDFVKSLCGMRSRQTAVTYANAYRRFWLPVPGQPDWFRLHPSFNPTGTDTLRWSSSNPNAQNISKKESFNLRRCFGPMPGREWWSMDGKNLELRIPAYEAQEEDLVWVFDHPDEPPYYGSYHLVVFDALHPALFAEHGKRVKDLFESTWYQWVKNGNFACIYGAQRKKADQTYHVPGAYDKISRRFPRISALAARQKAFAERFGFVETIPDRSVCEKRGYPLLASRTEDGRVSPTAPLNYHISGTAMQWTNKAMIRTDEQLREWQSQGWDGFLTLQVHDELVFDCPRGTHPTEPWRTNLDKMLVLKSLMEAGGNDISVPTPVSVEWHGDTWATGLSI